MTTSAYGEPSLRERLGGRWAISWQGSVIIIPLGIAVIALSEQATASVPTWLLIAVVAAGASASWDYLMHRTIFRDRAVEPVPIRWVAGQQMVGALLYVGTAASLVLMFHLSDPGATAVLFLPLFLVAVPAGLLMTLVLDSHWRFRIQRAELIQQAVRQQLASAQELDVLREVRDALHRDVREQIRASSHDLIQRIDALVAANETEVGGFAQALRDTADQTVRPLSHQLAERARRAHAPPGFPTALSNIVRYQPFRPVAVSMVVLVMAAPRDIVLHGWVIGLGSLAITTACIFAIMLPLNRALDRWPTRHVQIYLTGLVLIQVPTIVLAPVAARVKGTPSSFWDVAVSVLLGTIIVVATSSFGSWNRTRRQVIADFEREVDEEAVTTFVRAEALVDATREAAEVLHGSVQSRLRACAAAVDSASRTGDVTAMNRALIQARAILEQPVPDLQHPEAGQLGVAIRAKAREWQGLVGIDVQVDPVAEAVSGALAAGAADVVEEAIANAIHHGSASQVSVRIEASDPELVITVQDNGTGPGGGSPGLGSQLYSRFGGRWSLTSADPGSVLSVRLQLIETASRK